MSHADSGGQALARDLFHLFAKTIQLLQRSIDVRRYPDALELFMHDRHGEDVLLIE